jgi:hypothetical protein
MRLTQSLFCGAAAERAAAAAQSESAWEIVGNIGFTGRSRVYWTEGNNEAVIFIWFVIPFMNGIYRFGGTASAPSGLIRSLYSLWELLKIHFNHEGREEREGLKSNCIILFNIL